MANPFSWVWKEVRGNAIWDAIKWLWAAGGSGVTLAVQWIVGEVRGHQDLTATAIVGLAFIFFGTVALVIHKNPVHRTTGTPPEWPPDQGVSGLPAPLEVFERPQKLKLEILEGYVGSHTSNLFSGPETWILLKVRVGNRTEPDVKIKKWEVEFSHCHTGEPCGRGHVNPIPIGFRYATTGSFGSAGVESSVDTRIDERTSKLSVAFGSHEEGFILLRSYVDDLHQCFGYGYTIKATDSLDGVSESFQPPGEWLKFATLTWPTQSEPARGLIQGIQPPESTT